jgi:dTDP-glucose 4,6-dehydratase
MSLEKEVALQKGVAVKPTVLVTGVYGFIGSSFAKMAISEGWNVIGLARDTIQSHKRRVAEIADSDNLSIVHADLISSDLSGIMDHVDYVVHFAAKTFVDYSIRDASPFVSSNVVGTYRLLEQARLCKPKLYIQVSTDEVYGQILEGAYGEMAPLNPRNPYAATKAAGDMLAICYHNTYGVPAVVTRTENNYGPWQSKEKVFPAFVRCALEGKPLPVYGDGGHSRMWLHVEDHCRAILLLLEQDADKVCGEIFHIAGSEELTNHALASKVIDTLGFGEIEFVPDHNVRPGHDRRYALDSSKVRELTGWKPTWGLDDGIRSAVEWYRDTRIFL